MYSTRSHEVLLLTCVNSKFRGRIGTKVLRVFFLAIHSHLYSFVLRFWFLQTHATSYSFYRGRILGRNWDKSLKSFSSFSSQSPLLTNFTPTPQHCIRKPQVWGLSRVCTEPKLNCTFMNSASVRIYRSSKPVAEFIDPLRELKPA